MTMASPSYKMQVVDVRQDIFYDANGFASEVIILKTNDQVLKNEAKGRAFAYLDLDNENVVLCIRKRSNEALEHLEIEKLLQELEETFNSMLKRRTNPRVFQVQDIYPVMKALSANQAQFRVFCDLLSEFLTEISVLHEIKNPDREQEPVYLHINDIDAVMEQIEQELFEAQKREQL